MTLAAFDQARGSRWRRAISASIWLAAILITLHPISAESLWWELSKGRAVTSGSWHPTADLIVRSAGADADWLSGVIPYLLYEMCGISGLMGLKILVGLTVVRLLIRRTSALEPEWSGAIAGIALIATLVAMRQAFEPGPILLDSLGFIAVFLATERLTTQRSLGQLTPVLLLLALWANLGPRVVVGILVAGLRMWPKPARLVHCLGVQAAMLGCASLAPAGWMTLRHSLIQTCPALVEPVAYLQSVGWNPWWKDVGTAETLGFLLLSVIYLLLTGARPRWQQLFVFLAAQSLACCSTENLPLAALWLILTLTASPGLPAVASFISKSPPSHAMLKQTNESTMTASRTGQPVWQGVSFAAVLLWFGWTVTHPWMGCESGVGWGLDPRLNPDAFAASLAGTSVTGNAHCVGLREAGLLSWHAPKGVRPEDTPTSALLNRRLGDYVLLTRDLSQRWQTQHRRSDGSWGGWWRTTQSRGIAMLIVPAENVELIEALEPTIWKPFSLNAVSLVYGVAGDPGGTHQIVKTLSLRQIVDHGAWTYQPESEAGSDLIELFAWPGDSAATCQSLRLARAFRGMGLNFAALKILQSIPGRNRDDFREEFFANQMALGCRERLISGRSSEFRLLACLLNRQLDASTICERLNWSAEDGLPQDDMIANAIQLYAGGKPTLALSRLSSNRSEVLYAKALVLMEAGETGQAKDVLDELIEKASDRRLSALARNLSAAISD